RAHDLADVGARKLVVTKFHKAACSETGAACQCLLQLLVQSLPVGHGCSGHGVMGTGPRIEYNQALGVLTGHTYAHSSHGVTGNGLQRGEAGLDLMAVVVVAIDDEHFLFATSDEQLTITQ